MGDNESWQDMLGKPAEIDPLMEYGRKYHKECEEYDRSICSTINIHGIAIPQTIEEFKLSVLNSIEVKERLKSEMIAAGLASPEEASAKIQEAICKSYCVFDYLYK